MQTIETLTNFIAHDLLIGRDIGEIDKDQSLIEAGIIDSLGIMKLIAFIETNYKVKITDEELIPDNFETIAKIALFISAKGGVG